MEANLDGLKDQMKANMDDKVVEDHIEHQQQVLQLSKYNLNLVQNRMNKNRKINIIEKEVLKQSQKQELNNYEINQIQSISTSGRTYSLNIPHGRMRILYRSIKK